MSPAVPVVCRRFRPTRMCGQHSAGQLSRSMAFVVAAFFTGAAGSLLAHQIGTIAPRAYYFTTTFNVIIMVVLGGLGSVSGAVIGATVMTLAPEYLRDVEDGMKIGPIEFGEA